MVVPQSFEKSRQTFDRYKFNEASERLTKLNGPEDWFDWLFEIESLKNKYNPDEATLYQVTLGSITSKRIRICIEDETNSKGIIKSVRSMFSSSSTVLERFIELLCGFCLENYPDYDSIANAIRELSSLSIAINWPVTLSIIKLWVTRRLPCETSMVHIKAAKSIGEVISASYADFGSPKAQKSIYGVERKSKQKSKDGRIQKPKTNKKCFICRQFGHWYKNCSKYDSNYKS